MTIRIFPKDDEPTGATHGNTRDCEDAAISEDPTKQQYSTFSFRDAKVETPTFSFRDAEAETPTFSFRDAEAETPTFSFRDAPVASNKTQPK